MRFHRVEIDRCTQCNFLLPLLLRENLTSMRQVLILQYIYIYIDARSYSLVPCFRIRRRMEEEYLPLTAASYKQTRTNVNKRDDVIIKERIERWSGEVWFLVAIPLRNPLLHLFSSPPPSSSIHLETPATFRCWKRLTEGINGLGQV